MDLKVGHTTFSIKQGDITKESVDAIVNAANSGLLGGGGVDGAIHRAGGPGIRQECERIVSRQGTCPPGEAVITGAGNLPARFVIHTVGPVWSGGERREPQLLSGAYKSSLLLAHEHEIRSIAFPAISTGAYRYPIEAAAEIALGTCADHVREHPGNLDEIRFVLFSQEDLAVYKEAAKRLLVQ